MTHRGLTGAKMRGKKIALYCCAVRCMRVLWQQVMVEGPNPKDGGQATGRTRHNKPVFFPADGAALKGQLVTVHVDKVHAYTLYGQLVS